MAPIARLTALALVFSAAFVNAAPALAPYDTSSPPPALTTTENYASAVEPVAAGPILSKRATATVITTCTKPGTIAITFDDGPSEFTDGLLDFLKKKNAKVTFFLNGNNYGNIENHKDVVKRAYKDGHQIASHTYSHADLATLSKKKIETEMKSLDTIIKKIIGVRPTYMRPPYGSFNKLALDTLGSMGYKVINWDRDTQDWQHPDKVLTSLKVYEKSFKEAKALTNAGHIFLQHDTNRLTALELGPKAIDMALKLGYKVVTVGSCLGNNDPKSWYRV
ncbi:hypothetical protein BGZ65_008488 [Modicella reniformis]|uniref:NodB homology domain-containing protein n=1 Tax=Modicella reniformis TaxID=1440133 RepID=A0A9P6IN55_9FUNG|nr:hypothetical protein BGZ65_008488 [Modicella reniformis]